MAEIRLRESDYLKAWVIFFLVATVGGAIAGGIGGFIIGVMLAGAGTDGESIETAGAVVGFILALPVSYVVYRWTVSAFIVPRAAEAARQEPATLTPTGAPPI